MRLPLTLRDVACTQYLDTVLQQQQQQQQYYIYGITIRAYTSLSLSLSLCLSRSPCACVANTPPVSVCMDTSLRSLSLSRTACSFTWRTTDHHHVIWQVRHSIWSLAEVSRFHRSTSHSTIDTEHFISDTSLCQRWKKSWFKKNKKSDFFYLNRFLDLKRIYDICMSEYL